MSALRSEKYLTVEDFLAADFEGYYELIDGVPYLMSPPMLIHQRISRGLFGQLFDYLKGKSCEVFDSPTGVQLELDKDEVLIPDIIVVCDKSKLSGGKIIKGPPDLIIEILSPSTARHDKAYKFNRYLQSGVKEYWIVDPETKTVSVHILDNNKYIVSVYVETNIAPVSVLDDCLINLQEVFVDFVE